MAETRAQAAMKRVTEVPNLKEELKKAVDPKRVGIWERRLVNPGRESTVPVVLKDESFTTRWVNTVVEGRFFRATHEQGWEPVRPDELMDSPEDLGFQTVGSTIRRGDKGVEVLMKMPTVVFKKIQRRKAQLELDSMRKTREQLSNAAAQRYGSNAGDWASGRSIDPDQAVSGLKGKVLDFHERRVIDSEGEGESENSAG